MKRLGILLLLSVLCWSAIAAETPAQRLLRGKDGSDIYVPLEFMADWLDVNTKADATRVIFIYDKKAIKFKHTIIVEGGIFYVALQDFAEIITITPRPEANEVLLKKRPGDSKGWLISTSPLRTSLILDYAVNPHDGAEMLCIPLTEKNLLMGSNDGEDNERPQHAVFLDKY